MHRVGGGSRGEGLWQPGKHARSRVPWSYHRDVGEESAGGPDGSSLADSNIWFITAMGARLLGKVKNGNLSHDDLDDSLQKQIRAAVQHAGQAEQQGRRGKGAKAQGEAY